MDATCSFAQFNGYIILLILNKYHDFHCIGEHSSSYIILISVMQNYNHY